MKRLSTTRIGLLCALPLALTLVIVRAADVAPAASSTVEAYWIPRHKAAAELVRQYFAAYQRRDKATLERLFDKDARIVRYYGQQIDIATLLKGVSALSKPAKAPEYTLGNFEFVDSAPVTIVAFDLQATTDATGEAAGGAGETPEVHKFRASWILDQTSNGARIAWATDVPYGIGMASPTTIHPATPAGVRPTLAVGDEPAALFVERFFHLFDPDKQQEMRPLFMPLAKLVHCEGTEQSIDGFLALMAKDKTPQPKTKALVTKPPFDHITLRHWGDVELIAFDNHVWHWREGDDSIEHAFRENWLLKQTPEGLKALWVSYSLYGAIPVRVGQTIAY